MIFFIMAAVAAVPLAAWKGYPGVVASWALLIVGALAEPPPMMTGRKVAGRPPEPAGPHEERAATAYAMYRTWQWRMWTPTFDWGPGWPIRLSWIAALFAAIAALGLPVTQPIWALGNAAAAYLLTVQIQGQRPPLQPELPRPDAGEVPARAKPDVAAGDPRRGGRRNAGMAAAGHCRTLRP
jgi:hypothetical protein